ncbi:Clavaminate synthase-like protein [Apiospora aurea]|uniref:Clavaminate synthase-like protein n=1 Tax=Apiospora aurea TaxID=335848 RepID=A0ABR1PVH8_9PEZI
MSTTTVTDTTPAAPAPSGQPDIAYAPDYQKWQARAAWRLASDTLPTTVPQGFPGQLSGDLVWEGDKLAETYTLGLSLGHLAPETFPLPALDAELRRLSRELHTGHGFFVLRGLRVDDYSREENAIIYAGVSSHIAPQRGRQDHKLDGQPADVVLTHIKDLRGDKIAAGGAIGSPAYTTDKQVFHTDSGDIVSLFALEKADKQWTERPLMFHSEATDSGPERIALQYARRYFVGFGALPRSPDIPPISEAQADALDTLHFLGDKFCVKTDFQKGDMQYVNNLAVFHARNGFTDSPGKKRHLLRLWLRDPENAWETPEVLRPRWAQLYDGITPESQVFPLEPYIRSAGNRGR